MKPQRTNHVDIITSLVESLGFKLCTIHFVAVEMINTPPKNAISKNTVGVVISMYPGTLESGDDWRAQLVSATSCLIAP